MSQMTSDQYVATGGTKCPFCGSEDIEGTSIDVDAGIASQEMSCNECDEGWTDEYTLTGFRPDADN